MPCARLLGVTLPPMWAVQLRRLCALAGGPVQWLTNIHNDWHVHVRQNTFLKDAVCSIPNAANLWLIILTLSSDFLIISFCSYNLFHPAWLCREHTLPISHWAWQAWARAPKRARGEFMQYFTACSPQLLYNLLIFHLAICDLAVHQISLL
jgi:hypothetical protein